MKKQAVFLFIPLLFTFDALGLHNYQQHIQDLNSFLNSHDAQLAPAYNATTSATDSSNAQSPDTSADQNAAAQTSSDAASSTSVDNATSVANTSSAPSTTAEGPTSTDPITIVTNTLQSLGGLIPQQMPIIPGVPNTGVVSTTSTDPSLASTSVDMGVALPTTTAPIIDATIAASTTVETPPPPETASSTTQETQPESQTPPPSPGNTPPTVASSSTSTDQNQTNEPSTPVTPPDQNQQPSEDSSSSPQTIETPTSDIFSSGAVTFRFDDGWQSQIDAALPALESAGIKGTFYIVTRQLLEDGFSGFFSADEVKQLAANGEEIGAHTETHPHMPTLSAAQQKQEIEGAKSDLQNMGITAQTFSYPYGEYTPQTTQLVKDAGYISAVSTIETPASKNSDRYQIPSPSIQLSQTPVQIKAMIDNAVANHQWLVMTFHRIDNSGDQYSITPENFQEVVNYVKSHNIPTVTVTQGAAQMQN